MHGVGAEVKMRPARARLMLEGLNSLSLLGQLNRDQCHYIKHNSLARLLLSLLFWRHHRASQRAEMNGRQMT